MKIKFVKEEESRANSLYLSIEYMGGDADTEHFVEEKFTFPYSDWKNHIPEIEERVKKYKILEKILDCNDKKFLEDYNEVEKEYGKEMAQMFDNAPNDPQSDYSTKTSLSSIELIGYDEKANKYKSYT